MTHKHWKNLINFIFWSAGCSLLRAEVFSCSLDISKLQSLIKKNFWSVFFSSILVIKNLYPDWIRIHLKCWIRIRIQWIRIICSSGRHINLWFFVQQPLVCVSALAALVGVIRAFYLYEDEKKTGFFTNRPYKQYYTVMRWVFLFLLQLGFLGFYLPLKQHCTIPLLISLIIPFVEKLTSGSSLKLSLFIAVFVSYSKAEIADVSTISCTCKSITEGLCPCSGGTKYSVFS